ncbi:MAG: glycosyltransferase family 1 protein, partial [Actinomycetia bacterium]|nr:glycosyltransferase family 1 protein [Actinomycetes bacterium]
MTERLRVLRVIARLNVGGPALQVVALTRGLDPERFDHRVLAGSVGPDEADYVELRAPDVHPVLVPGLGRRVDPTGELRALAFLRREMASFRPHIVHTHTAKAGVLGRVAAKLTRVPVTVHTFHGHLLTGYFGGAGQRAVVATERTLARRTTALVAVGAQVRDDLVAAGIGRADQYTVVPPGVTVEARDPGPARAALGVPEGVPVVAFVARLTAIKRPERVVAVARRVLEVHPDARFVVAGEGPLLEDLKAAAAPFGDRFVFLGWRPDVDVVYAAADLALLTSANEGMPVSLIEAAAAGRPVVSTRVGSVAEVVVDGETGVLVDQDVDALAEAVLGLLADGDRRRAMGVAAAAWAAERFGTQRLVDDISGLYER